MSNAWEKETDKRISELENNHTALDDICKFMFEKAASGIEELENRLSGSETITADSITQNKKEISLLKKRISELEARSLDKDKSMSEVYKEIAELKERDLQLRQIIRHWNPDIRANSLRLNNYKEVLRDTINLIPKYEANEFETIDDMFTEVNRLLAKLDGESEFQLKKGLKCSEGDSEKSIDGKTEKKEVVFDLKDLIALDKKKDVYDDTDNFLGSDSGEDFMMEDSGGEKECLRNGDNGLESRKTDQPQTDSKPPEPREDDLYELYLKDGDQYYFKKTTHPFTEYNNMVNLGIGEMKVKREDLQWLLQMSKIARKHMGRPVDEAREKRIKEEYNI